MATSLTNYSLLGTQAPDFTLPDTITGKSMGLQDLRSDKATVVMFICNHCPYVKHVQSQLVALANDYQSQGVSFIAISANDPAKYPEDGPDQMKAVAERLGYPFPNLFDESQDVARAYGAACTPDNFVYDSEMALRYRGQLDDTRPGSLEPATAADVRAALDALLAGQPVDPNQRPSVGCSIKWKN